MEVQMEYSAETLQATMNTLTPETAMRMIALAGGKTEFNSLLAKLARNFGANVPDTALQTINDASKRWNAAPRARLVSYSHD